MVDRVPLELASVIGEKLTELERLVVLAIGGNEGDIKMSGISSQWSQCDRHFEWYRKQGFVLSILRQAVFPRRCSLMKLAT